MKTSVHTFILIVLILSIAIGAFLPITASDNTETENKYYLGESVNTGKDNGYSGSKKIKENDPHFGWKIGEFFISGYSDNEKDSDDNPVFLKNVGDQITLWFCLNQDIDKLNGNKVLSISNDKNGYDEYFGIEKTNFEKGVLIIRKKDSENHWNDPIIYTNYLKANTSEGAYTQVELFEEGDYEVALNYEIKESGINIFGWNPLPSYYNYRIFFKFSVRNGNCMVYPFDVATGAELTNSAFTENGFYLDLANSKYLDIIIKKEVFNESSKGLVEDIRFNKPAKDGEKFTEEGIYTITVTNEYTNQETVKKIYVGTNEVLKAHVATGFSIEEINNQISLGATIGKNGELIPVSITEQSDKPDTDNTEFPDTDGSSNYKIYLVLIGTIIFIVPFIIIVKTIVKGKKTASKKEAKDGDNE